MSLSCRCIDGDVQSVIPFINEAYLQAYGTTPPVASAYALVEDDGVLLGCIGVEWADADGMVPVARAYRIDLDALPQRLTPEMIMQYGRWVSLVPIAGIVAIHTATVFALARGRSWGFVEHDKAVHRRTLALGIRFTDLPRDGFDISAVAEHNRPYYRRGTLRPYLVELEQVRDAVGSRLVELGYSDLI